MSIVRLRLTGPAIAVERVMKTLESLEHVDRIEEVGDQQSHLRDDSTSLGLVDDLGTDFHDVEVHAQSDSAAADVRDRLVLAARSTGVALEFVDRF
ncbi:hypothetical protein [Dokdonella sp.]|uniref:hypothetical protein n=1 Tax=Dokdonella sp. TaxID=2291710 RepID=UPI001B24E89D|nr:hypothetical protein [Dokdonella sp.]MBO9662865.1 hypothetical protein [Dokdonella sp.]